jgi:C1A family cysteine protease
VKYILGNISIVFHNLQHCILSGKHYQFQHRKLILFLLVLVLIKVHTSGQEVNSFKMLNNEFETYRINHNFTGDSTIYPFSGINSISGLAVTGEVILNSDTSLVRIILVDNQYNEYLVHEIYPLLAGGSRIKLVEICEETANLDNIIPLHVKIELIAAQLTIAEVKVSGPALFDAGKRQKLLNKQQLEKLQWVQENIAAKNLHWQAGETSITALSFAGKKLLFGGKVPNLNGFEYYTGGIFSVNPGNVEETVSARTKSASGYINEFSWKEKHGIDWTTPVKSQGTCASCWAFSSTGATEMLVNLYFNRKIDPDLSEQNLISSVSGSTCNGGYPGDALRYIRSDGIVSETCMPYASDDIDPEGQCVTPDEKIHISGIRYFADRTEDNLKAYVIGGPVSLGINTWKHTVTLVGYKVLEQGDTIRNQNDYGIWTTLNANDPLIGKTAWIIKNSWGTNWGDGGYAYLVVDMNDISSTYQVFGAVQSLNYNTSDILCTDNDGDGYYSWGIGTKPEHCPDCPDKADGDDSDPCIGPVDEFGISLKSRPVAPVAFSSIQCETQNDAVLTADGENIKWYSDGAGPLVLSDEKVFSPGQLPVGLHQFYATQTIGGCESLPDTAILKVYNPPQPPVVTDLSFCEGELISPITADGEDIRWYNSSETWQEIHSGKNLEVNPEAPGTYTFYVTQTQNNCESHPVQVTLTIHELPEVDLGMDITLRMGESLEFELDGNLTSCTWSDGVAGNTRSIETAQLGLGSHVIWVEANNSFNCISNDTIGIQVLEPNELSYLIEYDNFVVFPNPSSGRFNFMVEPELQGTHLRLRVFNITGQLVWQKTLLIDQVHPLSETIDLSDFPQGMYQLVTDGSNHSGSNMLIIH